MAERPNVGAARHDGGGLAGCVSAVAVMRDWLARQLEERFAAVVSRRLQWHWPVVVLSALLRCLMCGS